jgi:hypothetical protein
MTFKYQKADYEAAIPKCCGAGKTWDEHWENLMLCWGLLNCMEENKPTDTLCKDCEFNREH